MKTYENEQVNQTGMGNLSTQQTDPRTQEQDNSENDMMSLRSDNMNKDREEEMDEETMVDDDMGDDGMEEDDDPAAGTTVGGR